VEGDGPPLVIIHGLNDIPESFAGLVEHLKWNFQCILYRLPEGGHDGVNLHRYRHEHFCEDLLALLNELKLDSAHLLGSSFGSTIALRTAAIHSERVRRVVLQGGFASRRMKDVERFLARLGRSWPWRMGQLPIRHRVMRHLEKKNFQGHPEALTGLVQHSGQSAIRAVTHRARLLETLDLRPLLPMIRQPVLLVGGDRDHIVPRDCERELERRLPDVRRVEFTGCGHYPHYTRPAEMAAVMREHLLSSVS
jgi:pimeloyl-ACP methyl ester carboxylesterase